MTSGPVLEHTNRPAEGCQPDKNVWTDDKSCFFHTPVVYVM